MSRNDNPTDNYDLDFLEPMDYQPRPQGDSGLQTDYGTSTSSADYYSDPEPFETQPTEPKRISRRKGQSQTFQSPTNTSSSRANKPSGNSTSLSSVFAAITGRRVAIFFGVILILTAAYLLIVSISYFFNGAADQSIVTNNTAIERVVAGSHDEVGNTGNLVGAWIAEKMMSQWLGIGAFVLIFYIAAIGLTLVRVHRFNFWTLTVRCLFTAIALSIILGLFSVAYADTFNTYIYPGGMHGHQINRFIVDFAGWWGAVAVSILMATIIILLFLDGIKSVIRSVATRIENHRRRVAERRAEQEEIAAAEEKRRQAERQALEAQKQARREAEERERLAAMAASAGARNAATDLFEIDDNTSDDNPSDTTPSTAVQHEKTDKNTFDEIDHFDEEDSDSETDTETDTEEDVEFTITQGEFEQAKAFNRNPDEYDPTAELSNFKFPPLELLKEYEAGFNSVDEEEQEENKERITKTLNDYKIAISSIKATVGPTVTLYEIVPAEGVRINRIKQLEDDIALSLSALGIRIIAPIPGRGTIGIEVPNRDPQTVSMRSIIGSKTFQECHYELPMALGRTISNEVFIADLAKIPHLLVAGATGTGKSVGLNDIIASLLYKKHPSQLKFVMIDPKMVEFSLYRKIEHHYLAKLPDEDKAVITDVHKATATLNSLCVEMDNRYALLENANQRNIKDYNAKFVQRKLNPANGHRYLPYIVVIVDEFADLIMQVGKEIETPIARIAQKARAVGIHMILATQRPSTNVITGVIKANFPGRIAFRVFQMVDSKTILDRPGANQLIGRGDMLFSTGGRTERVQAAFIDTPEVEAICDAIEEQAGYPTAYELPEYVPEDGDGGLIASASAGDMDPLFEEIARLVATTNQASASSIQRRYSIGYNRAGRIMDQLEAAGIVGPSQGGKPRQVLMDAVQIERILGSSSQQN